MKIHLDIRDNISPTLALECVKQAIERGKISADGKSYCCAAIFDTDEGKIWVVTRPYRKSSCFLIYKKE